MPDAGLKTQCERCGTCCMKGGPALHLEDAELLKKKIIGRESLITIRKGEPVILPDREAPVWSKTEIIKLRGKPSEWTCIFFDGSNSSCSIYQHRPQECALLKCWDTVALRGIAGRNLLKRSDIIAGDEPVMQYIDAFENECGFEILAMMNLDRHNGISRETLAELNDMVNRDLTIRATAQKDLNLSLELELFYFGRPVFTVLSQFSLIPREVNGKIYMMQSHTR
jgi:Fe-S-cluster containining protein